MTLLLADRCLRERPKLSQLETLRRDIIGPLRHRNCERYAFDDAASDMVGRMGTQLPDKFRSLLTLGRPACDLLWIEWNHGLARRASQEVGVYEFDDADSEYVRRMGVLATRLGNTDGEVALMFAQENDPSRALAELMYWPVGYVVSTDGTKLRLAARTFVHDLYGGTRAEQDMTTRRIWGFGGALSIAPLRGLATIFVTPGAVKLRSIDDVIVDKSVQQSVRDLIGALRLAVAALAILNAVAEIGAEVRPPGLIRGSGDLKPYVPRRLVTVRVPKHRSPLSFARSRILAHHKRLHEVRSHWRHLGHEPRASGWERIEIDGRTLWRKSIAKHLRGNPDVGVVEHDGARVAGPRPREFAHDGP
jgi:hypothetical protein